MENQCVMCGDKDAIEYSVEDSKGNIKKDFACKSCAEELGLETSEEEEKRNRLWWRSYLKMRLGKEISDEDFEVFYINRTNPKAFKGCDECSSSDCKKNYPNEKDEKKEKCAECGDLHTLEENGDDDDDWERCIEKGLIYCRECVPKNKCSNKECLGCRPADESDDESDDE